MATVSFPPLKLGMALTPHIAPAVRRSMKDAFDVASARYSIEPYTVLGTSVVSGVDCPASVTCTVSAGRPEVVVEAVTHPDAGSNRFECDARFLPTDASIAGELDWPARYGRFPFALTAAPGREPIVLTNQQYTYWHNGSRVWIPSEAVQFTGPAMATSANAVWAINPKETGGFGMAAVMVVDNPIQSMPLLGFISGGRTTALHLESSSTVSLRVGGVALPGGLVVPAGRYNQPMGFALAFEPPNMVIAQVNVAGADRPLQQQVWRLSDVSGLFAGQVGVLYGDADDDAELLDLAVWREGGAKLTEAWAAYNAIYGV